MPNKQSDGEDNLQAEIDMLFASFNMLGNTQLISGVKQIIRDRERSSQQVLLNNLNQELFYSTTQPDGQFIKDSIMAKLDALDKQRVRQLTQGQGGDCVSLCTNGCNCMTHTLADGNCGKCGADKTSGEGGA